MSINHGVGLLPMMQPSGYRGHGGRRLTDGILVDVVMLLDGVTSSPDVKVEAGSAGQVAAPLADGVVIQGEAALCPDVSAARNLAENRLGFRLAATGKRADEDGTCNYS